MERFMAQLQYGGLIEPELVGYNHPDDFTNLFNDVDRSYALGRWINVHFVLRCFVISDRRRLVGSPCSFRIFVWIFDPFS